jgi:hypothetical protein
VVQSVQLQGIAIGKDCQSLAIIIVSIEDVNGAPGAKHGSKAGKQKNFVDELSNSV